MSQEHWNTPQEDRPEEEERKPDEGWRSSSSGRRDAEPAPEPPFEPAPGRPRRGRRLTKKASPSRRHLSGEQRLLALDTWQRSGLPAKDFAPLLGVSPHSLYKWRQLLIDEGPARLLAKPGRKRVGSALPIATRRAIQLLKETHPEWGCQRISDELSRGPALAASPGAVTRALKDAGYELEERKTRPHRDRVRRFEREAPHDLWQTDLFTFVLKRQNRRVYLVAFLDDHSRFLVSLSLGTTQTTGLVLEALRSGLTNYGLPKEVLTDNGAQYVTWRGKSAFSKECEKRGIRQIVARPRRPQTLGKIERFWGTLWRELLEVAVFVDLADARRRIEHYVAHYNFRRPHQGIEGLVPADRFFEAAPQVRKTLEERVDANALELARSGEPKKPFYLTGQVGGQSFSVHAEGERVYMRKEDGEREEIDLTPEGGETAVPPEPQKGIPESPPVAPGTSALDAWLSSMSKLPPRGAESSEGGDEQ